MLSSKYNLIAISSISLINLILYGIFQNNLIFGIMLFAASILLYFNYTKNNFYTNLFFFILLGVLILVSLKNGFDNNLLHSTALETDRLVSRHEYFANEFGKLYKNRVGIEYVTAIRPILIKFNKNIFSHLDLNLLFNVKNIISLFFIPLFILGFYNLSKKISKLLIFYLITIFITGGFLSPGLYGYLMYIPLVNLMIFLGLLQILRIKHYVEI